MWTPRTEDLRAPGDIELPAVRAGGVADGGGIARDQVPAGERPAGKGINSEDAKARRRMEQERRSRPFAERRDARLTSLTPAMSRSGQLSVSQIVES